MILRIPELLDQQQLGKARNLLEQAQWVNGSDTAGHIAASVKQNQQLPMQDKLALELGHFLLQQLNQNPEFVAGVLPLKVLPPRFNRYAGGETYGNHIDNSIMAILDTGERMRCDVSSTLFLSDPDEYEGGELVIEDTHGSETIKLPAGHMVIYPGNTIHRVNPVTKGVRYASFFWTQSLIRDDHKRQLLWQLDQAIQSLGASQKNQAAITRLSGIYHNLIREWANT